MDDNNYRTEMHAKVSLATRTLTSISHIIMGVALVVVVFTLVLYLTPWYMKSGMYQLGNQKKYYYPGDTMNVLVERKALTNLRGFVTRELIRVDAEGTQHELSKTSYWVNIDKGKKVISLQFALPEHCFDLTREQQNAANPFKPRPCVVYEPNTYMWKGTIMYRPFGMIRRIVLYESVQFQIRLRE